MSTSKKEVIIDTGFMVGLWHQKDQHHVNASFLLRIEEGKRANLSIEEIIEHMVEEDVKQFLDTSNPETSRVFVEQRRRHYEELLRIGTNVSILSENISAKWEHSFLIPCYQDKVKEMVERYRFNQKGRM